MAENLPARLEQAYQDIGQHYGYVACIDEAADRIRELEADRDSQQREAIRLLARVHQLEQELAECKSRRDIPFDVPNVR